MENGQGHWNPVWPGPCLLTPGLWCPSLDWAWRQSWSLGTRVDIKVKMPKILWRSLAVMRGCDFQCVLDFDPILGWGVTVLVLILNCMTMKLNCWLGDKSDMLKLIIRPRCCNTRRIKLAWVLACTGDEVQISHGAWPFDATWLPW